MKLPPTPLQERTEKLTATMVSMYTQAGPGAVEVPNKTFIEIHLLIGDLDMHTKQLEITVSVLSKKLKNMSKKCKKIDMKLKRVQSVDMNEQAPT